MTEILTEIDSYFSNLMTERSAEEKFWRSYLELFVTGLQRSLQYAIFPLIIRSRFVHTLAASSMEWITERMTGSFPA